MRSSASAKNLDVRSALKKAVLEQKNVVTPELNGSSHVQENVEKMLKATAAINTGKPLVRSHSSSSIKNQIATRQERMAGLEVNAPQSTAQNTKKPITAKSPVHGLDFSAALRDAARVANSAARNPSTYAQSQHPGSSKTSTTENALADADCHEVCIDQDVSSGFAVGAENNVMEEDDTIKDDNVENTLDDGSREILSQTPQRNSSQSQIESQQKHAVKVAATKNTSPPGRGTGGQQSSQAIDVSSALRNAARVAASMNTVTTTTAKAPVVKSHSSTSSVHSVSSATTSTAAAATATSSGSPRSVGSGPSPRNAVKGNSRAPRSPTSSASTSAGPVDVISPLLTLKSTGDVSAAIRSAARQSRSQPASQYDGPATTAASSAALVDLDSPGKGESRSLLSIEESGSRSPRSGRRGSSASSLCSTTASVRSSASAGAGVSSSSSSAANISIRAALKEAERSSRIEPEELKKALDVIAVLENALALRDEELLTVKAKLADSQDSVQLLTKRVKQLAAELDVSKNDFSMMESLLMESGQTLTKLQDMYHKERDHVSRLNNAAARSDKRIEELEKRCELLHRSLKEFVGDFDLDDIETMTVEDLRSSGRGGLSPASNSQKSGTAEGALGADGGETSTKSGKDPATGVAVEEFGEGEEAYDGAGTDYDAEGGEGVAGEEGDDAASSNGDEEKRGSESSSSGKYELSRYDIHGYHVKLRSSLRSMAESLFDELVRIEEDIAMVDPILDIGKPVEDEVTASILRAEASKRRTPPSGPDFIFGSPSARLPVKGEALTEENEEEEDDGGGDGDDDQSYQTAQELGPTIVMGLDKQFALVNTDAAYVECDDSTRSRVYTNDAVDEGKDARVSTTGELSPVSPGRGLIRSTSSDSEEDLDAEQLRQMEEYFREAAMAASGGKDGAAIDVDAAYEGGPEDVVVMVDKSGSGKDEFDAEEAAFGSVDDTALDIEEHGSRAVPSTTTMALPKRRGSIPSAAASGLDEDGAYAEAVNLEEIEDFQLRKKLLKQQLLAGYDVIDASKKFNR